MQEHNYSVIIPFRDCLSLLKKACASIPVRDDIQVLVVDNSSEYVGFEAILEFGNPNIQYLTSSPVGGAGCARNVGLKHADGKYLLFLDADDYFTPNAFAQFDKELNTNFDIIFYNAVSIYLCNNKLSTRHHEIDRIIKNSIHTGNEDLARYRYVNPCCKMIRRTFVQNNNIQFQETPVGNDVMFSVKIGHYANKIKIIDFPAYTITEGRSGSSLTKIKTKAYQFIRFQVIIDHHNFVKSVGRPDMSFRIASFIFHAIIDFGVCEGLRWIKYALDNKVNPLRQILYFFA